MVARTGARGAPRGATRQRTFALRRTRANAAGQNAVIMSARTGAMITNLPNVMKRLFHRVTGRYRGLREDVLRHSCRGLVSLSTVPARMHLRHTGVLKILIDNSVLFHAVTHETGWISTGTKKWGPLDIETGYAARIPVHSPTNDKRVYNEVRYLAGIAHLARRGALQLFDSAELQAERFRQPMGRFRGYGYADLGLFNDVKIESIDDGLHLDLNDPKETQLKRVDSCSDPQFRSLLDLLGQRQSLDAYHVYTADKFDLFCFLHIDFPLEASIAQHASNPALASLKTKVLRPSQLGRLLGLLPIDTNILSYEGSSFPVHPELHWDTQARKRPKKP